MDEFLDDLQLSGERINDLEEVVGVNRPEEEKKRVIFQPLGCRWDYRASKKLYHAPYP